MCPSPFHPRVTIRFPSAVAAIWSIVLSPPSGMSDWPVAASQRSIVAATAPTSVAPSGEKQSPIASRSIFSRSLPVAVSNSRVDEPSDAAASVLPSGEKASDRMLDASGNGMFSRSLPVAASTELHRGRLPVVAADRDGRPDRASTRHFGWRIYRTGGGPVPGPCPPPTAGRSTPCSRRRTRPRRGACRPGRRPRRTRCRCAGTSGSPGASRGR